MPAPFFNLRRQRPLLLRASTTACVLAGALTTLAGVSALSPEARNGVVVQALRVVGTGEKATARISGVDASARRHDLTSKAGAGDVAAAPAADPPPFAPGGDDLLISSDESVPQPQAAIAPQSPAVAPRPDMRRMWLERSAVGLGETAVLHLSAPDATTSCRGAGALEGVVIQGHRTSWRVARAGLHRLAVVCSGPGGEAVSELTLTVPVPVALSSIDNHRALQPGPGGLPGMKQLGLRAPALAGAGESDFMVAGDFLQQGRLSLFVVAAGDDGFTTARLMASDGAGRWIDRSADLLDDAERGACASATQVISSDFNRDGRPDAWIACDGRQLLFLSQADGRYRRIETPFELRALRAEARDVDGDGWPDIITLDTSLGAARTLLLLGRGDGRFEAGPAEAWRLSLPLSGSSR